MKIKYQKNIYAILHMYISYVRRGVAIERYISLLNYYYFIIICTKIRN